ncbi:unnamed protein product [Leuciscus chuanchicus]
MDDENCGTSQSCTSVSDLERPDKDEATGHSTSGITSQHDTAHQATGHPHLAPNLDTPISRGNKRKRKGENMMDALNAFMDLQKVQHEEFCRAEQARGQQESATLAQYMQAQQEADERRYKALQEQQAATTQMFVTLMNNICTERRAAHPTSAIGVNMSQLQSHPTPIGSFVSNQQYLPGTSAISPHMSQLQSPSSTSGVGSYMTNHHQPWAPTCVMYSPLHLPQATI